MKARSNPIAYALLAPHLLGFAVFCVLPIVAAMTLAFFQWDLFHPPRFVGLENFRRLLGWSSINHAFQPRDPRFWRYLGNTLFLMLAIPFSMTLSLLLAMLLNQKLPGRVMFRTIFFLPTVCAGVGLLLLWKLLYNPNVGLINSVLADLGIRGPGWLQSYFAAKPAIMIMNTWILMGGTNLVLYLAGLQGIPPELYEAAHIDGAGPIQRFRHITVPMLRPTTFFILITSIIAGFQTDFEAAYILTRGGPDGATTTLAYYIYLHAFEFFNMGYAAALAAILFLLVLVVTIIQWRTWGMQSHYA